MNHLITYNTNDVNWIDFYTLLGQFSKSLQDRTNVESNLVNLLHDTLCFAKQNNIDMNLSWNRWLNKINYKIYY